jgi:hypothetical protein
MGAGFPAPRPLRAAAISYSSPRLLAVGLAPLGRESKEVKPTAYNDITIHHPTFCVYFKAQWSIAPNVLAMLAGFLVHYPLSRIAIYRFSIISINTDAISFST